VLGGKSFQPLVLTPTQTKAPNSSLVHMFECVRQKLSAREEVFFGDQQSNGAWSLDATRVAEALAAASTEGRKVLLLGTAFNFVHLLDDFAMRDLRFTLPAGSRVMETGGYKGRSRELSKDELHAFIAERLGILRSHVICEYGMSELSSQAYDGDAGASARVFRFPPWCRIKIISPETGREVNEGEAGLVRVFDLANAFSVMAVQTEDLAVRRGDGFELIGRVRTAEARGCSLMQA
jgi:hypothetical protein